MKIVCFGDSITDMGRNKNEDYTPFSYGSAYPFILQSELGLNYPHQYEIINRGISGNRVVDLYARIKCDLWNLNPDFISVLIGVNDVWHTVFGNNGVEIDRFEKVYDMLIKDTLKTLPNVKIVLLEPFFLHGSVTDVNYEMFKQVKDYAKVVKKLAENNNCGFIPLQNVFDEYADKLGADYVLTDGVHPTVVGAKIIANEWLKYFKANVIK